MKISELITYLQTFPADTMLVRFDDGTQRPNLRWEPLDFPQPISLYRPEYTPCYFREWKEGNEATEIEALEF